MVEDFFAEDLEELAPVDFFAADLGAVDLEAVDFDDAPVDFLAVDFDAPFEADDLLEPFFALELLLPLDALLLPVDLVENLVVDFDAPDLLAPDLLPLADLVAIICSSSP